MSNWAFTCFPNGIGENNEGFYLFIVLLSWPLAVSKMIFIVKLKGILNAVIYEAEEEFQLDMKDPLIVMLGYNLENQIKLESINDITFNAIISIKELYDMDDREISVEKWKNHNVQRCIKLR